MAMVHTASGMALSSCSRPKSVVQPDLYLAGATSTELEGRHPRPAASPGGASLKQAQQQAQERWAAASRKTPRGLHQFRCLVSWGYVERAQALQHCFNILGGLASPVRFAIKQVVETHGRPQAIGEFDSRSIIAAPSKNRSPSSAFQPTVHPPARS